jgi:hypothetical protein
MYNFYQVGIIHDDGRFFGDMGPAFNFLWIPKMSGYLLGALVACCVKIYEEHFEKYMKKYL